MDDELPVDTVAAGRQDHPALGVVEEEDGPLHRGLQADGLAEPVVEVVELALLLELEEEANDHVQGLS